MTKKTSREEIDRITDVVRHAPPTLNPDRKPQTSIEHVKEYMLDVTPIPDLIEGELAAVLEREGIKSVYDNWADAKSIAVALSDVGGIDSVTVVSRNTRITVFRSEVWKNGKCVSMNGGITELDREGKKSKDT